MFQYGAAAFAQELRGGEEIFWLAQQLVRALPHPAPRPVDGEAPSVDQSAKCRVVLDGGRIGPIVAGGRVGLHLWCSDDKHSEIIVWIDAGTTSTVETVARCLMAVDAPFIGWTDGEAFGCDLAAITRLTGLSDEEFATAARTLPIGQFAALH